MLKVDVWRSFLAVFQPGRAMKALTVRIAALAVHILLGMSAGGRC